MRPCSILASDGRCCDSIYIPSFFFENAFGFPQDRQIGFTVRSLGNGTVGLETIVHGVYSSVSLNKFALSNISKGINCKTAAILWRFLACLQPMEQGAYPYERLEMSIDLKFVDTSVNGRVQVVPSASGIQASYRRAWVHLTCMYAQFKHQLCFHLSFEILFPCSCIMPPTQRMDWWVNAESLRVGVVFTEISCPAIFTTAFLLLAYDSSTG